MSETVTILELPRTKSSSDDSFTALMNAVLDSARSSGSQRASTRAGPSSSASTSSSSTTTPTPTIAPPIAESVSTNSTNSSRSSSASASTSASASAPPSTSTSTNPSPCPSILRSSSSNLTLPSRTGSPNITFAPLPATEPRKRNSPHPLGVAARSRLLRHRRMLREHGLNPDDLPYQYGAGAGVMGGLGGAASLPDRVERPERPRPRPGREWDGPVEIREAQAGVDADEDAGAVGPGRRKARARAASDPDEGDARVSLGRLVKGAGKSLWRSISMKDVRAKEKEARVGSAPAEPAEPPESQVEEQPPPPAIVAPVPRKTAIHLFDDPDAPTPHSEGGVWEEEVEEESWKKLLIKPPGAPTSQPQETPDAACTPSESASGPLPKRTSKVEVLVARVR